MGGNRWTRGGERGGGESLAQINFVRGEVNSLKILNPASTEHWADNFFGAGKALIELRSDQDNDL